MKKNKIFISIASYRDPELVKTIDNCIANAKHPKNLVFAISRQYNPKDKFDDVTQYKKKKNFKFIETHYTKSLGVCHARHQLQQLHDGEQFYLQLDSHHRFQEDWDEKLLKIFQDLKNKKSEKPILSSYLPAYDPDTYGSDSQSLSPANFGVWRTYIDRFMPEGPVFIAPENIDNWKRKKKPERARFLSGHFIFCESTFIKDVPYDPNLYFHGEESSLAARAYTHGYDLFHLPKPIVLHHYTRKGLSRHWDDHKKWQTLNTKSFLRYRKLFGMDGLKRVNYPKYGFGKVRSLEDYEKYAGIRFKDRKVHQDTVNRKEPPIKFKSDKDFESKLTSQFKYCIDIHKPSLPENDYDVWVMAFKDDKGNEMIRLDAGEAELNNCLKADPKDDFVRFWRSFNTDKIPSSWLVWPHSKSKGWMSIIEGQIPTS
jgi:hypothetical protein